ncbi:MAG: hypothetical protein ACYDAA_04745 [Syntrophales bacterium]
MQAFVRILSEDPLVAIAVCFVALLILYFLFKSLIKLALIVIIIVVAIGGYSYFREPRSKPANLKEALEKARIETGRAIEKGKEAVEKGREMVGKGKEAIEKGRKMVDKGKAALDAGIEKGKEVVGRGKETATDVGEILGAEREAGRKERSAPAKRD